MSDTDTRSVAEIMWTSEPPSDGSSDWRYEWQESTREHEPDCDDMLAFLRERCADLRCFTLEPDGMSVHVRRLAGSGWTFHQGDTLHAALEAAVRAVAEAE